MTRAIFLAAQALACSCAPALAATDDAVTWGFLGLVVLCVVVGGGSLVILNIIAKGFGR